MKRFRLQGLTGHKRFTNGINLCYNAIAFELAKKAKKDERGRIHMTGKKVASILVLILTLFLFPTACADGGVVQGSTVSGTVRVYLSSIASRTSVDVSIDGSYSIGGDTSRALKRGAKATISNSGGTLLLTIDGRTETMGSRFKLRRHQTSGENGVRIAQARYPRSLYPGDIEFIAKGGNVQIVVHVFMEDYMHGVLPYEMDNSFPLEALKAQAVAARTYALKKMSAQASTYDVVDTTSDQVYNGTPPGNQRCRQAVEETTGQVGTVRGEYMASYYTASNGGQTESVQNAWGSGSYAYLQVKDDPYDLRNGASIAKSVTFYRDGTTSVSALTALLETEAAALLGIPAAQIEGITSVSLHSPKYDEPSRVYKKVDVGLQVAGYGALTVTLDYFSQVESLCAMSINVLKNETLTVTETVGGYKLTARRFGHGVGMSQRGAQQMAAEGLSYDQILDFYYPGLVRTRYTMTRTLLPSMDGTPPQPDEPLTDAKTAIITLRNPLDSLNLRQEQSTSSAILAQMPHGTQVILLEKLGTWSRVQHGTLTGYVMTQYLSVQDEQVDETPSDVVSKGTATVALSDESQTLNLRAAPTTNAAILARLRHGQTLNVLERYERWSYVQFGKISGYVMNDYVVYDAAGGTQEPEKPEIPHNGNLTATVHLQSADSKLNLREGRSLGARVLLRLSAGEKVDVLEWGAEWSHISARGVSGYCATAYLRFDEGGNESSGTEMTAIVLPESGLNLRSAASPSSSVLMTLPQGTLLRVMGEVHGNMLPVALGSVRGFVASEYVYVTEYTVKTPEPTQTPVQTPVPTSEPVPSPAERVAYVTASGGLKLREEPNTGSSTLMILPFGADVRVQGEASNGFYPVQYGEITGYVSQQYLTFEPVESPMPTPVPEASRPVKGQTGTVTAPSGLNLRADSSTYADVRATLGYGVEVLVTGERINGFYPVRVGTLSGYVSADYISFEKDAAPQTVVPTPTPAAGGQQEVYRVVVESENGLNLRAQPDVHSQVLYVLPYGMVLTVLGENENGFLHVQWAEYTGYVSGEFVTPFGV